jgi:hypothetical protein
MAKRCIGVTLIAGCLSLVPAARAQELPCPTPPPVAEPMPAGPSSMAPSMPAPSQNGPAYPGPMNGLLAPRGPSGEKLELPADIKNAFPECPEYGPCGFYANIGAMGLVRQRLGHLPIAIEDPQNLDTGIGPIPLPPRTVIDDLHDMEFRYAWGPRLTLGWFDGPAAWELTGFYLPDHRDEKDLAEPGRLDSFFINPPIGFEGDNGLWLQADVIRTQLRSTMGDFEVNYRRWSSMYTGMEWIYGVRYLDLLERLEMYTGDDDLTIRDVFGAPDPTRAASYIVRTHSRIVGPQIGWEASIPLCKWLEIGGKAKGCVGANFADLHNLLERGDGLVGLSEHAHPTICSGVFELGLFVDWFIWERGRLHVGYDTMFLVHVPEAQNEWNYDLANQLVNARQNGNIFYHGPVIELQILW